MPNSYKFKLPQPNNILGLPIGQHVSISAHIDGKDVVRSYTPVSSDADRGFFSLLIKTYPTGNISRFVSNLNIGQTIKVRGPKGQFVYTPNMCKAFGMIAGGTGITPMLQIIRAVCNNPEDKTEIDLIFANVNEEDILLKEDLDELARENANFRVHYVLNNPPEGWSGAQGFVTADMIKVGHFFCYSSERHLSHVKMDTLLTFPRNGVPPRLPTSRSLFAARPPWSAP